MNRAMIRTMAVTSLMIAITIIMAFTLLGTIPLPMVSVTIAFLPAIVTVMLEGFAPGLTVATAAGLSSMIRAYIMPTGILFPFIQNPLVSVLPRMLIAVTVFLVFKALIGTKLPRPITIGIAAAAGSITNTVAFLGMMWLIYAAPLHDAVMSISGTPHASVWAFMVFVVTTNATIEVIVNTIIATLVVTALMKARFSAKIIVPKRDDDGKSVGNKVIWGTILTNGMILTIGGLVFMVMALYFHLSADYQNIMHLGNIPFVTYIAAIGAILLIAGIICVFVHFNRKRKTT